MESTKRAALYSRVSTNEQSTALQESELRQFAQHRGWSVAGVFSDTISGKTSSRPALDAMMADCRKRKVDIVLVWKFDRFARSLRHLVTAMDEFKRLGVDFVSATENLDTSVPSGELIFQIFGAIAQFERALIAERVKAGLAHAKSTGVQLGRPSKKRLTGEETRLMRELRAKGATIRELAHKFGCSVWTAHRATRGGLTEFS